jgi:hypothetical protein
MKEFKIYLETLKFEKLLNHLEELKKRFNERR